jgi:hypothetical protein
MNSKFLIVLAAFLTLFFAPSVKASVRPEWVPLTDVKVGKSTVGEVLKNPKLGTYDVYCASSRISWKTSNGEKYLIKMFYPAITNSQAMVSTDTECSFNVKKLRAYYVTGSRKYREIATGTPEFEELLPAAQLHGFLPVTPYQWCRAQTIGVYGSGYTEIRYSHSLIRPFGVYSVYVSRDMQCATNPDVIAFWEKTGWVKLGPIPDPWP